MVTTRISILVRRAGRTIAAAAVAATLLVLHAAPAPALELKLSHQWKQGSDARDAAARVFIKEVTARDPSIRFRVYPGRSLIANPIKQLDALQDGSLEMSIFPLMMGTGKVPDFSVTILPGTIRNLAEAARLKNSRFHEKLQQIAMANGIRIVTWWWSAGGFATKDAAVTGPTSVAGLKMRAADPYMELMLKEAGASIYAMPSTEVYAALQSGVIDGLMTTAETFSSMRIYEQTGHATIGGDNALFIVFQPLVMSLSHWNALTAEQKAIFEAAADVSDVFYRKSQETADAELIKVYRAAGKPVHTLTDDEYDAWVKLARAVSWPAFEKNAPDGKDLLALLPSHQ